MDEIDELREELFKCRQNRASNLQTIKRYEAALSWIAVGQGRLGWRGHVVHANEALYGLQAITPAKPAAHGTGEVK